MEEEEGVLVQDCFKVLALNKQAMQMVNGREGWLLLHLVSVF